jgi:hypothetical protein
LAAVMLQGSGSLDMRRDRPHSKMNLHFGAGQR